MITTFAALLDAARAQATRPRTIAVAGPANEDVVDALTAARDLGLIAGWKVGEGEGAASAASAVRMVADGEADVLMKGLLDTSIVLKAVLNAEHGLRTESLLSHVGVFDVDRYPKLLAVTDPAMNIAPDVEAKAGIIRNAVTVTRALGIETAKVACLAAKEKVNPKMLATVDAAELASREFAGAIVGGPLALDNAIDPESVRLKGIDSPVAGDADVLLVPTIEAGNVLYKALNFLAHAQGAGIIVGAKAPIVLTSRADDEATKLNSIALALVVAGSQQDAAADGAAGSGTAAGGVR